MPHPDPADHPGADERRFSPSAARNRGPILEALRATVAQGSHVLEIASGSGEHAVHCAGALGVALWQPSDPDPQARASIEAWRRAAGIGAIAAPLALDVRAPDWPDALKAGPFETVLAVNMIHIAPWSAAEGLIAGAAQCLAPGGALVLYGPFKRAGRHTAPSNEAFDASLRSRDPAWGVRDLDDVAGLAQAQGFETPRTVAMPANNNLVVLRRRQGAP